MAFFEELGRKAKDVAAVAADKAKDMAAVAADKARETTEKTKISVAIAGEQREIEKNCRLIGEWFINEYEGELPEGVQELADAVAASKARIAELEEQKNAIKVEHSEVSAAEPGHEDLPGVRRGVRQQVLPQVRRSHGLTHIQKTKAVLWAALVFARNRGIA